MLKPLEISYDPSNNAFSVFYLEVLVGDFQIGIIDIDYEWKSLIYGFPSLGEAMLFCQPQLEFDSEFKMDNPGLDTYWTAPLSKGNNLHPDAVQVRVKQLVMVKQ